MSIFDNWGAETLEGHKAALETLIRKAEAEIKKWKDEIEEVIDRLKPVAEEAETEAVDTEKKVEADINAGDVPKVEADVKEGVKEEVATVERAKAAVRPPRAAARSTPAR